MSQLQIPISSKWLFATGDVKLWVNLHLLLKNGTSAWCLEEFRVDTATDVTTFPAYEAKRLGLLMPQKATVGASHTQTGLEIRAGYLRFRIAGLDATEYATACLFLGDPDVAPDPSQLARLPRKLFQPFHLLDRLRFTMDKDPNDGTPYGTLTVQQK